MHEGRIKLEGVTAHYHVMSRFTDRQAAMDADEMHRALGTLRRVEAFCGVRVLTYALMRNHFHILLEVPAPREVSDEEVVRRMDILYTAEQMTEYRRQWTQWRERGQAHRVAGDLDACRRRMYDLSEFMKTFKQRVSMAFNGRNNRFGTLWTDRFRSVLVEGRPDALGTMAAYIDLNPVRAGLVGDPKDYRFCGYGEAVGGGRLAAAGLAAILDGSFDGPVAGEALARYRVHLFQKGEAREPAFAGQSVRPGIDPQAVDKVLEENGKLDLGTAFYCRVRYFTHGRVLGCRVFVEDALARRKVAHDRQSRVKARDMRHLDAGDLHVGAALRGRAIIPPAPS